MTDPTGGRRVIGQLVIVAVLAATILLLARYGWRFLGAVVAAFALLMWLGGRRNARYFRGREGTRDVIARLGLVYEANPPDAWADDRYRYVRLTREEPYFDHDWVVDGFEGH